MERRAALNEEAREVTTKDLTYHFNEVLKISFHLKLQQNTDKHVLVLFEKKILREELKQLKGL